MLILNNLIFFFFSEMFIIKYNFILLFFNILLLNSIILAYDLSSVLDNFIIGTPKVVCEETEVAMDIVTAKPFIGTKKYLKKL